MGHDHSHSHDAAGGSGAIATDQVFKAGDGGATNYVEIEPSTGRTILHGTARIYKPLQAWAYNMAADAGTFNGVVCAAAGAAILSDKWWMKTFDKTAEEACQINFVLPDDYVVGTDIKLHIHWTSIQTSGGVVFQAGILAVGDGEDLTPDGVYASVTGVAPATAWYLVDNVITLDGSGASPDDAISIVIYRDTLAGGDDINGDVNIMQVKVKYIANKLGGDVS